VDGGSVVDGGSRLGSRSDGLRTVVIAAAVLLVGLIGVACNGTDEPVEPAGDDPALDGPTGDPADDGADAAADGADDGPSPVQPTGGERPTTEGRPGDDPGAPDAPEAPTFDWDDLDMEEALVDGWVLRDCEGDAPLRCLYDPDGSVAGTIELLRFPQDDRLQGATTDAAAHAALDGLVTEFDEWLAADRAEGCPGHTVTSEPPQTAAIDGAPAVVRSYGMRDPDGRVVESSLAAYLVDGADLVIISIPASTPGTCLFEAELSELQPEQLDLLRPALIALIERGTVPGGL
jgi:hypothetical protein